MQTVAIFCGGFSSEFDISIKSATTILSNFPKGFDAFLVYVKQDKWQADYQGEICDLDLNTMCFLFQEESIRIDIGLVYIHGDPGENGKIQAFLEMKGINCLNSGALASEISFDKWFCNQFLKGFEIPVANSILLTESGNVSVEEIVSSLGLPIFVKPSDSGSSYGISKVKVKEDLQKAIDFAFQEGRTVVLESFLDGIEVTCGVYTNKEGVQALPLTEIYTENDFFDYAAKYEGKSQEITPARISDELTLKVQEVAIRIYKILRLKSISRIDFMLVDGTPHVIEVNTTPGFSAESIVPKMLACKQMSIKSFWKEILSFELKELQEPN
jgi:D-alanine-D-alanine ligase